MVDPVCSISSKVEFLERFSFHASLDSLHAVFLNSGLAWSCFVAPLSTLPGFTASPLHVMSSDLEIWTKFFGFG